MVFSMLHYSISQSNNSTFVHRRILSCLIVYGSPHPVAAASTSPFAACLWTLWCVVTMETGPSGWCFCSGLEVKDQAGPRHPRNAGG